MIYLLIAYQVVSKTLVQIKTYLIKSNQNSKLVNEKQK